MTIRRRFLDRTDRQLHYRECGEGAGEPVLLMIHLLPGSSLQLAPLMQSLAPRHVLAPDIAGAGDSDPLDLESPTIGNLTADVLALMETHGGRAPVDLYGTHTGACIAVEIARMRPELVRRLVIDGVPMFDPHQAAALARDYAPLIAPDYEGTHFLKAHGFCRDQFLFYPWFDKSAAAARGGGLPDPDTLFAFTMEVLKAIRTIPALYHAAFTYPMAARLPEVTQPTLCLAPAGDTLAEPTRQALALLRNGALAEVQGSESDRSSSAAAIVDFLGREAS